MSKTVPRRSFRRPKATRHADAVLNVVDDSPPTQWSYARQLRRQIQPRPRVIGLPRFVGQGLAGRPT